MLLALKNAFCPRVLQVYILYVTTCFLYSRQKKHVHALITLFML